MFLSSSQLRRLMAGCLFALLAACLTFPTTADASESRSIDGDITLDVGFITEPPIQNDTNGLRVVVTAGDEPVEGLESTLTAQAIFAGETRELPLSPVPDEPGVYTAIFIPTQAGEYTFSISGSVDDQPIDETFASSPDGVPLVASRLDYEFPTAAHGSITTLAWPAGATLLAGGIAIALIRRQRIRA